MKDKVYAVLTGDIINSRMIKGKEREVLLKTLNSTFDSIPKEKNKNKEGFKIFRGDSFQGIIFEPEKAIIHGIKIRAILRSITPKESEFIWDTRISIGLGQIDYFSQNTLTSDGEVFRNSGLALDKMETHERTKITTPWQEINQELNLACVFLDTVIDRWKPAQARMVEKALNGLKQQEIAKSLDISQPAVSKSLQSANWHAVELFIRRYQELITNKLNTNGTPGNG
ncbi:SatD family protein [Flexithrix dorotheae]|uniref:SatD family protein n=1 Tax=Flexithrix dorotheae TaxID=70993 RepID=UPI000377CA5B|nr:SatD family protein [Flexithrix dorotheae]